MSVVKKIREYCQSKKRIVNLLKRDFSIRASEMANTEELQSSSDAYKKLALSKISLAKYIVTKIGTSLIPKEDSILYFAISSQNFEYNIVVFHFTNVRDGSDDEEVEVFECHIDKETKTLLGTYFDALRIIKLHRMNTKGSKSTVSNDHLAFAKTNDLFKREQSSDK